MECQNRVIHKLTENPCSRKFRIPNDDHMFTFVFARLEMSISSIFHPDVYFPTHLELVGSLSMSSLNSFAFFATYLLSLSLTDFCCLGHWTLFCLSFSRNFQSHQQVVSK